MQILYVNVFLSDLVRATQFYEEKLGLDLQFSSTEHDYASFSGGGVRLGIAVPDLDQKGLVRRHTVLGLVVSDPDGKIVYLRASLGRPWLAAALKRRN